MPFSFAQTVTLTCSQCRQSFNGDVWLIVNVTKHPDILKSILEVRL